MCKTLIHSVEDVIHRQPQCPCSDGDGNLLELDEQRIGSGLAERLAQLFQDSVKKIRNRLELLQGETPTIQRLCTDEKEPVDR